MGNSNKVSIASEKKGSAKPNQESISNNSARMLSPNAHVIHEELKVHAMVTDKLDPDHHRAQKLAIEEVSDEQLIAEISRRRMDIKKLQLTGNTESFYKSAVKLRSAEDLVLIEEVTRRHIELLDKVDEQVVHQYYDIGRKIGKGASAEVFVCTSKSTNEEFACKVIAKNSKINDAQSMGTEIEIMKRVRHENIVAMYEIFESEECLWLILEFVDFGNLRSYLMQHRNTYTEENAAIHMKQILSGVHYLHAHGIVHRDLKLENILLKKVVHPDGMEELVVKIADFGLSALVRVGERGYDGESSMKRKSFHGLIEPWGTPEYEAPELLEGAYGPQADMWAIGCMLHEMLTGRKAFYRRSEERTLHHMYARILHGQVNYDRPEWSTHSEDAKNFVKRLLIVDEGKRYCATEALDDRWIRRYNNSNNLDLNLPPTPKNTFRSASPEPMI